MFIVGFIIRTILRITWMVPTATVFVIALVIAAQDFLVFPNLILKVIPLDLIRKPKIHADVTTFSFTSDRIDIEMRKIKSSVSPSRGIILLFHGNGGTVDNFYPILKSFAERGYTTYGMEYRGYGNTPGWPSVNKIVHDAYRAMRHVSARESVPVQKIIPVGISLGTGFAALLAAHFDSEAVVLVSPFTTLRDAAKVKPYVSLLTPFMWNDISNLNSVEKMKHTCVVAAHGKKDNVVPYEQSLALSNSYQGTSRYILVSSETAGHNDIFFSTDSEIARELENCLHPSCHQS